MKPTKPVKHQTSSSAEPERVQKLIAAAGLCSRREAEDWIRQERVEVNGELVKIGASATRSDHITVNGVRVTFPTTTYIMLHKPKNYVTTMRDVYGKRTVLDLVVSDERIYPVGRLDKDTTGLLLFTNDGEFANRVMHPRYELEKVYLATIDKPFNVADSAKFEGGIRFEEGIVRAQVRARSPRKIEVRLHQGYNHVVKRLCAAFGYRVLELERIRIGPLALDIPLGAYRPLKPTEVEAIMKAAQPKPRPSNRLPGEELKTRFSTGRDRVPHFVPPHDRLSLPRAPPRANRGEAPANMWEELGEPRAEHGTDAARYPSRAVREENSRRAPPAREAPRSRTPARPPAPRSSVVRAPFSPKPGARRYGGARDQPPTRERRAPAPRAFGRVADGGRGSDRAPRREDSGSPRKSGVQGKKKVSPRSQSPPSRGGRGGHGTPKRR